MPRKRKSEVGVESKPAVTLLHMTQVADTEEEQEEHTHPTELNRLISEEEYSNERAEVLVMNHTPVTSSPSSSNSRHNSQSQSQPRTPPPPQEDLDKISSEEKPEPRAPEEEDVVDECAPLHREDNCITNEQPHVSSSEYKKIMDMLKEAEAEADPEYEDNKRRMEFLLKYNLRHPDTDLGFVDYCCAFFQCFALCIDG